MIKREVGGVIQCLRELRTLNSNNLRRNFENLRCVTNFRRGSDMVGSTRNCIQCFEIWAGAQLEPVFGGLVSRFKFFKFGLSIIYLIKILNRVYHNIKPHSFNLLSVPPSLLFPTSLRCRCLFRRRTEYSTMCLTACLSRRWTRCRTARTGSGYNSAPTVLRSWRENCPEIPSFCLLSVWTQVKLAWIG